MKRIGVRGVIALAGLLLACTTTDAPSPLVFIGGDGAAYTLTTGEPQPVDPTPTDEVLAYRWASWNGTGTGLALLGTRLQAGLVADVLTLSETADPFETRSFMLSGTAIYAAWAPHDDRLALIVADRENSGVRLMFAEQSEPEGWRLRDTEISGRSIYFAWDREGQELATRWESGGAARLGVVDAASGQFTPTTGNAGHFRAPSWSAAGFVGIWGDSDRGSLGHASGDGGSPARFDSVAALEGRSAFVASHDGRSVAYVSSAQPSGFLYRDLMLLDVASDQTRPLVAGDLLAFFWSPDDRQIAYVIVDADRLLRWEVVSVDSGETHGLVSFQPSADQFTYFRYFDQYATSTSPWSPDGRSLVFSGRLADGTQGILRAEVADGRIERLAAGRIATWPVPRP